MPSHASSNQLGEAILHSVQNGTYPDSEDIISAAFPPSAFSDALKLLDNARDQVKAQIRTSSKDSAPDIDRWISQAKQLRGDIEKVHTSSNDILIKARRNDELQQNFHDAESKLHLLEEEVAFNRDLAATLDKVLKIRRETSQIQDLVNHGELVEAIEFMVNIGKELGEIESSRSITGIAILRLENKDLRRDIVDALSRRWHGAMKYLGLLDEHIVALASGLEAAILLPRLQLQEGMHDRVLDVAGDTVRTSKTPSPSDMHRLIDDLSTLIRFLNTRLPPSVVDPLSKVLTPSLIEKLITMRLFTTVPEELAALRAFDSTRDEVRRFSETISSYGWPGESQLRVWMNSIPALWVEKRQMTSIDNIRRLLRRGYGNIKTVERVETQIISQQDHFFTGNTSNDNWNAGWSDEEESSPVETRNNVRNSDVSQDEEDVSAWGLDNADEDTKAKDTGSSAESDEEGDAWGWGDENNHAATPQREPVKSSTSGVNEHGDPRQKSERKVTLREMYNITALPIGILDLINNIMLDMDELKAQNSPISSATSGLSAVASLLLVMYRASATNFYSINNNGNMFLYNDCLWLADQIRQIMQSRNGDQRFENDIAALEAFGKRSYGKEMESQRTIIKDLLDGAQGFANCTEPPFSQECNLAVNTIVDRLRDTYKQWKSVLSHSALLQSVGSLLSTVIDKILIDIEDMSDISEPESQRLTAYCKQVTALEGLFLPEQSIDTTSGGKDAVPLTAVYAPGWFKFQYLSEILDSSLVDIKYLWTDGGLKLEYDPEEVVELIEALFADSEHRRRAIGEIRRSSGR
ncbi:MAG: hypothetical protein Q9166_003442 [cf. Caloplaca sp. 2 TL-2023]